MRLRREDLMENVEDLGSHGERSISPRTRKRAVRRASIASPGNDAAEREADCGPIIQPQNGKAPKQRGFGAIIARRSAEIAAGLGQAPQTKLPFGLAFDDRPPHRCLLSSNELPGRCHALGLPLGRSLFTPLS